MSYVVKVADSEQHQALLSSPSRAWETGVLGCRQVRGLFIPLSAQEVSRATAPLALLPLTRLVSVTSGDK